MFFGFNYNRYDPEHVRIGQPVLISRGRRWTDRSLTWHAGGGHTHHTPHTTGIERPWCAESLPSHISKKEMA